MTEVVRLTLVSHAMTDAMAAARFPGDEPLNEMGRRQAEAVGAQLGCGARHFAGPEQRAHQTADLLGLDAATDPLLTDLNCGRWQGKRLQDVPPGDLTVWLTDPTRAPHGGESIADLMQRVARWLNSLTENASADRRGDTPRGDPGGDPAGPGRPREIVLAHRYRAGQSNHPALPRRLLDASLVTPQRGAISAKACLATCSIHPVTVGPWSRGQLSWKLTTYGCCVLSTAYQLNVRSPGRPPAFAPMYGQTLRSSWIPDTAERICLTGAALPTASACSAAWTRQMSSALPYHSAP